MKATRLPTKEDMMLRLLWERMYREPTKEPGVTQLIHCLTQTYYQRKHLPQMPGRRAMMLFATGLAIEKAILGDLQRPSEGVIEGISFHTDHFEAEGDFYEMKSTRTSSAKGFEELSKSWHRQWLSYLKAVDRTEGNFIILHLMGNYKPPFPDLVVYHVEASEEEIEENWQWMQERRRILLEHEEKKEPPAPFTYRVIDWGGTDKDYECEDCPYLVLCKARRDGLL